MTAISSLEWLQDTIHREYDALKLGPVELSVARTDEDAIVQVRMLAVKNREGACAISVFRFQSGNGDLKRMIQRESHKAARRLERAIWEEKNRKLDG